jgi:acyl-CoA synthetase (AMP-forming)/AMP-acid ligase II
MEVKEWLARLKGGHAAPPKIRREEAGMRSVDDITAAELLDGLPSRVHEVYAPFVRDIPDHPAFVEGGRSWSYRQFSEAVDAVAKDLSNLGIRPGDRVMIASENSVALGAMLFAASKLDAWGIAVNPRLSAREIDLIGTHSGARRVLFNSALSKEAADHASRVGAKIGAVGPFGGIGIGPLNADAQAEPVEKDGARQVAGLLYTSGTTGAPKGVMLSHRNLLFTASNRGAYAGCRFPLSYRVLRSTQARKAVWRTRSCSCSAGTVRRGSNSVTYSAPMESEVCFLKMQCG